MSAQVSAQIRLSRPPNYVEPGLNGAEVMNQMFGLPGGTAAAP